MTKIRVEIYVLFLVIFGRASGQNEGSFEIPSEGKNLCSYEEGCKCYGASIIPMAIICERIGLTKIYEQSDWLATFDILNLQTNSRLAVSFNENSITTISRFPPLPIETLTMRHNQISFIEPNAVAELTHLRSLDLTHNDLNEFSLTEVVLARQIPGNSTYLPLPIKHLKLSHNKIRFLFQNVFDHLTQLEILDLSHNPLKTLDGSTFKSIASRTGLVSMSLAHTQISSIPEGMFQNLKNLTGLDLSGNEFIKVSQELRNLHQLAILILDENKLEALDNSSFIGLNSLEDLSLRNNENIISVESGTFGGLRSLDRLDLSFCSNLQVISSGAFLGLMDQYNVTGWRLKDVHLNNNSLTHLDKDLLPWNQLDNIDIRNNPFRCDCNIKWIPDKLMPQINKISTSLANGIFCGHPVEVRGLPLIKLMDDPGFLSECDDNTRKIMNENKMRAQLSIFHQLIKHHQFHIGMFFFVVGTTALILIIIKRRLITNTLMTRHEVPYELVGTAAEVVSDPQK